MLRYPDISSILDVGCGDMAWMSYFLQECLLAVSLQALVVCYLDADIKVRNS